MHPMWCVAEAKTVPEFRLGTAKSRLPVRCRKREAKPICPFVAWGRRREETLLPGQAPVERECDRDICRGVANEEVSDQEELKLLAADDGDGKAK